ncbi:Uncharacterised protein [uncultured Clostridium sp.]|nr:Uncharacterised protein [uncultured Clostridium sp.]
MIITTSIGTYFIVVLAGFIVGNLLARAVSKKINKKKGKKDDEI